MILIGHTKFNTQPKPATFSTKTIQMMLNGKPDVLCLSKQAQSLHFAGRSPTFLKSVWEEHKIWYPKQKTRILNALEGLKNRIRTVFSGVIMALTTVFPLPGFLLQSISRAYFYSPRKVYGIKFKSEELNKSILPVAFPLDPKNSNLDMIHGFYLKASDTKPTIVFSHGRDTNIGHLEKQFLAANENGYGFFAYDYPGFGKSDGVPDEKGLTNAGIAACRYLASDTHPNGLKVPYKEQILMGYSLGGAVAINLAKKFAKNLEVQDPAKRIFNRESNQTLLEQPKALILINTFTDIKELFTEQIKPFGDRGSRIFNPKRIDLKLHSQKRIKKVTMPVLVFHGDKDLTVPIWQGKMLYDNAINASFRDFKTMTDSQHSLKQSELNLIFAETEKWLKSKSK